MILPKGIVVNAPEVEGSIERIDSEPLDAADIAKFWKVYTTTRRRLLDPTAERLENYWWRIWGSSCRELNGATIARLFAHISGGQSFVPLRGPANRDEGNPPLSSRRHNPPGPGRSSTVDFSHQNDSRPSTTSSSTASKTPVVVPHPILKKSRGPSTTGPRPTARFISPHDSENEADDSVSPNSHVVVQPPSPTVIPDSQSSKADKKAGGSGSGKKQGFVVSTASKKKRPTIVKRKSSQSSNDSISKTQETQSSVQQSTSEVTSPTFAGPSQPRSSQSRFQENLSPSPEKSPRKRKATKTTDGKRPTTHKSPSSSQKERLGRISNSETNLGGDPGRSTLRPVERHGTLRAEDLTVEELEELEMQRILLAEANAKVQETTPATTHAVINPSKHVGTVQAALMPSRSASEGNLSRGANLYLPHDSKTAASLAPTLAAATGELGIGEDGSSRSRRTTPNIGKGKGRDPDDLGTVDMFAKRPIQPVSGVPLAANTPGSLARSKSQLTLLLEKDRARSGEHKPNDDKKKGKKG